MLTPGTRLGPYEIQNTLGAGGMGEVYRARDTRLDRTVAIKVLSAQRASDPQFRERFNREARTVSQLDHPHICALYDVGEHDGQSYLVMQYLEGETLRDCIERGAVPIQTTLRYALEVAGALAKAHAANIVHRDLKPANVMLTPSGAKLLDFGIAKSMQPSPNSMDAPTINPHTETGMVVGTTRYMSPEQARGNDLDHRSDIFSLGVVIYEMLAGHAPFDGNTHADVLAAILERQPAPLANHRGDVPPALERLIAKCVEKVPARRYASAAELVAELERLAAAPVQAERPSIAVLPFVNNSADPENEYFCDGVAEELINALSKIEQLRVIARTTAFSFKGKTGDLREVGRLLNVGTVLEGSVRKAGNRLRVTAQLVNVTDGYQIWSERYDRQLEDVFEIQDEISLAIVTALKVKLLGSQTAVLAKRQTENVEAYQIYLQGRHHWNKWNADSFRRSLECMKTAIEIDPDYALAYCGIADVYLGSATGSSPYDDILPNVRAALKRALELDPNLDEAWILTSVAYMFEWNFPAADRAAARAVELSPRSGHAHQVVALVNLYQGKVDQGLNSARRAVELDPLAQMWNWGLALMHIAAGDRRAALDRLRILLEIDPNFWMAYMSRGSLLLAGGKIAEAMQDFEAAVRLSGGAFYAVGYWICGLAVSGEGDRAKQETARLLELSSRQFVPSMGLAFANLGLGDIDQVFHWLDRAAIEREVFFRFHIRYDPNFMPLHQDPRMLALFKRVGMPAPE